MSTPEARILHVDDDEASRATVARLLVDAGFDVTGGPSGAEPLPDGSEPPDLLILGVKLVETDGYAVTARIRANPLTRLVPVLRLTDPLEPTELVAHVRAMLRARRADRALQLSLEQNTVILQNIADAVTAQDQAGRLVYANDAALRLFGLADPSQLPVDDPALLLARYEMLDEQGAPIDPATLPGRRVLAGEPEARAVIRWRPRGSGEDRFTVVQSRPVRDDRGQVLLAINILHDVTERRRAEQRTALLSDVSTALSSSLDYDETVQRVVRLMVPTLGEWSVLHVIDGDEVHWLGCHVVPEVDAALRERARRPVPLTARAHLPAALFSSAAMRVDVDDAALAARLGSDEASALVRSLGTRTAMSAPLIVRGLTVGSLSVMSSNPRRYVDDELRLLEDVAHRAAFAIDHARLFRRAERAAELRRDLVAVVAHDLKNPLNAVGMAAALLARNAPAGPDGDRARRQTGIVTRAAARMNRLIHDLLDVSAIEAGHLELEPKPHRVVALVFEAIETMASLAQEKQLVLEQAIAGVEALSLFGDRERLLQVFSNLIGNAIKYTEPGGRITVAAERQDSFVRFTVRDSGPGIADEHLPHLFDRYWRVRGRAREGTGLGLWIVKGLVEAHGGTVSVDSRPGAGSTFAFTVPLAP